MASNTGRPTILTFEEVTVLIDDLDDLVAILNILNDFESDAVMESITNYVRLIAKRIPKADRSMSEQQQSRALR